MDREGVDPDHIVFCGVNMAVGMGDGDLGGARARCYGGREEAEGFWKVEWLVMVFTEMDWDCFKWDLCTFHDRKCIRQFVE